MEQLTPQGSTSRGRREAGQPVWGNSTELRIYLRKWIPEDNIGPKRTLYASKNCCSSNRRYKNMQL